MKKCTSIATALFCVLGAGCVGEVPIDPPGANRGPVDEGPLPNQEEPPQNVVYPEGPYGVEPGQRVTNHIFTGFADDDGDSQTANDPSRSFALAEYFAGFDTSARVIMMNVSAVWCAPCQVEATHMRAANERYRGRGARIFTVLLGDVDKARNWAELYNLPTPVLADVNAETSIYLEATPLNLFINPKDMTILAKVYSDEFQPVLEHYLDTL